MECNIIQDLIPLYIDGCCSEESSKLIEEHIEHCDKCKSFLKNAESPIIQEKLSVSKPDNINRISAWKASVLQSILFFVYFTFITLGVAMEARTPRGLMNSFWGFCIVIPATGFLVSLINWYFVRFYASRRAFICGSAVATVSVTLCCFAIGAVWYEVPLLDIKLLCTMIFSYSFPGTVFFVINIGLSVLFARIYAKLLGKE